jgi:transposase
MEKHRRQFSAALKAKIAVEAIKGQRTIQEIGSSYSVHPNQITKWEKTAVGFFAGSVFGGAPARGSDR